MSLDLSPRVRLERQFALVEQNMLCLSNEESLKDTLAALGLVAWNLKHWILRKNDLRDAAENILIAYGMGWDLEGVAEILKKQLDSPDPYEHATECAHRTYIEQQED